MSFFISLYFDLQVFVINKLSLTTDQVRDARLLIASVRLPEHRDPIIALSTASSLVFGNGHLRTSSDHK